MEIERRQAMAAKKFWNMVRAIVLMLRKELSKGRIVMSDLHLMMKRGKLAGKAMFNLIHLHQTSGSLSCRTATDIAQSIAIAPQDYEFSCSNSPAFPALQIYGGKRSGKHHHQKYNDVTTVSTVKRVLEMLNNEAETATTTAVEVEVASPSPMVKFGMSPMAVRVTDSPFPVKDECGDHKVDEAAEAFIKRFYSNLKQQRITAGMESPSPFHRMWGR